MFSKKAISPLIASVLIIGFTIALAVMIMTWGVDLMSGITGSTANKAELNKCV